MSRAEIHMALEKQKRVIEQQIITASAQESVMLYEQLADVLSRLDKPLHMKVVS